MSSATPSPAATAPNGRLNMNMLPPVKASAPAVHPAHLTVGAGGTFKNSLIANSLFWNDLQSWHGSAGVHAQFRAGRRPALLHPRRGRARDLACGGEHARGRARTAPALPAVPPHHAPGGTDERRRGVSGALPADPGRARSRRRDPQAHASVTAGAPARGRAGGVRPRAADPGIAEIHGALPGPAAGGAV